MASTVVTNSTKVQVCQIACSRERLQYGLHSYGLHSYGLYSCGLYSYGLYIYGIYNYGLYSYGLYSYGLYAAPGDDCNTRDCALV